MNIRSTGHALAGGALFAINELTEASKNDPALAMRISATALSDTLLNKVNTPIKDSFAKSVVPVVRGGILALNAVRCHQTFKDPTSTNLDKAMDVGRVVSDLVGFAGGLAVLSMPQHAELGRNLMGFSYAVDAVSHAYRGLGHAGRRITVWQNKLEEAKRAEEERQQKQGQGANPPADPTPPADPQMEVTIKGPASVTAAILQGQKPNNGGMNIVSTAKSAVG